MIKQVLGVFLFLFGVSIIFPEIKVSFRFFWAALLMAFGLKMIFSRSVKKF